MSDVKPSMILTIGKDDPPAEALRAVPLTDYDALAAERDRLAKELAAFKGETLPAWFKQTPKGDWVVYAGPGGHTDDEAAEVAKLRAERDRLRDQLLTVRGQLEEIERLRARLAEAERDAARYRWLRAYGNQGAKHENDVRPIIFNDSPADTPRYLGPLAGPTLDASIDAAMRAADSAPITEDPHD